MSTQRKIVRTIDKAVSDFDKSIPRVQREIFSEIEIILLSLDVDKQGNIKTTAANLRKIKTLKKRINRAILDPDYISAVRKYTKDFTDVTTVYNDYFKRVFDDYSKPSSLTQIKIDTIKEVTTLLTETGIQANITNPISTILKENVQSGAGFGNTAQRIRDFLTDNKTGKGALDRYTNVIINDTLNTYARTFSNLVSEDLDLNWWRYVGALVKGSRPWCQSMTGKEWVHRSELPKLPHIFSVKQVPLNPKTGLPQGMKAGTNGNNILVLAGGWNCNHQFIPVSEFAVPKDIRNRFE